MKKENCMSYLFPFHDLQFLLLVHFGKATVCKIRIPSLLVQSGVAKLSLFLSSFVFFPICVLWEFCNPCEAFPQTFFAGITQFFSLNVCLLACSVVPAAIPISICKTLLLFFLIHVIEHTKL